MHKISIVIITYNEENRIRPTLESIKWCDEIIVVDSCSTDKTLDICKEYGNCKVYVQPFLGYGEQKKFAVEKASHDWVLSLDADEVITEALRDEIIAVLSLPIIAVAGFYIHRTLVFMNRVFKYGSENKNPLLRLFNKNKGNFNTLKLHEGVNVEGNVSRLKNEILHLSYLDIHHYFEKFNEYTNIYKNEALKRGEKCDKFKPIFRLILDFIKQYFMRRNFLNGYPGFVWSVFSALYVFVKYTKLYEANLKK